MWIRTQDKKELVNVIKVEISAVVGDKTNKMNIIGKFAPEGFFSSNSISLGKYATMEDAIDEIDEIEKCIISNPNGVYVMRSNKEY